MRRPGKFGKVVALILGLFLAFFMTVEVAHSHLPDSDIATTSHCQLCLTAHVAIASQPAWLTGYVLHLIGNVSIGEPSRGSQVVVFTAFIRPPPAVAALT
jgi:hypothetical protein